MLFSNKYIRELFLSTKHFLKFKILDFGQIEVLAEILSVRIES